MGVKGPINIMFNLAKSAHYEKEVVTPYRDQRNQLIRGGAWNGHPNIISNNQNLKNEIKKLNETQKKEC